MVLPINARPKWAHWSAWKRYKSRSTVGASGAAGIIVRTASATTPELHALDPTRAGRDDASRQTDVSNMGQAPGGAGAEPPLDPLIDVLKEYPPNGEVPDVPARSDAQILGQIERRRPEFEDTFSEDAVNRPWNRTCRSRRSRERRLSSYRPRARSLGHRPYTRPLADLRDRWSRARTYPGSR